jgi:hypothetical protein
VLPIDSYSQLEIKAQQLSLACAELQTQLQWAQILLAGAVQEQGGEVMVTDKTINEITAKNLSIEKDENGVRLRVE